METLRVKDKSARKKRVSVSGNMVWETGGHSMGPSAGHPPLQPFCSHSQHQGGKGSPTWASQDENRHDTMPREGGQPARNPLPGHSGQQPGHAALRLTQDSSAGALSPRDELRLRWLASCPCLLGLETPKAGSVSVPCVLVPSTRVSLLCRAASSP